MNLGKLLNESVFEINNDNQLNMMSLFGREMIQNSIDAYLVVALALNDLLETGRSVETQRLTSILHLTVLQLVEMGLLRHMDSSFVEILDNAFVRFAQMGACKAQVFDTMLGGRVIYVTVPRKEEHTRKLE